MVELNKEIIDANEPELEIIDAERSDGKILLTMSDGSYRTVPDEGKVGFNYPKLEKVVDIVSKPVGFTFKTIFSVVALVLAIGVPLVWELGKIGLIFQGFLWLIHHL